MGSAFPFGDKALPRAPRRSEGTTLTRGEAAERSYGRRGEVVVDGWRMGWLALKHPGNSDPYWTRLHDEWIARAATGS